MVQATANDLDYLVARLHGRRSWLAEADRLDSLCRCRTIAELARAVLPDETIVTARQFQQRIIAELVGEIAELAAQLRGAEARLIDWMLARFHLENLKVALRGVLTGTPAEVMRQHLIAIPGEVPAAETLPDFVAQLPVGAIRESLQDACGMYRDRSRPFFFEAALDRGYYRELLARAADLAGEDRAEIGVMIRAEVDSFQMLLLTRGRFRYGLQPELLLPLCVTVVAPQQELVEARAWERFLRSANRVFRRSHIGFGVVAGYVGLRRIAVTNLITLSEGIRLGLAGGTIRARLIPRTSREVNDV